MRLMIFAIVVSGLAAQTPGTGSANTPPAAAGNAANGKKVFDSYGCYQCHGHVGQGGVGPRIAPRPIPFAAFSKYVRQPAGEMPPYTAKVVSAQDLLDIYSYLQSIPAPPSPGSLSLLNR
jgi:mono/diheme cytochrome c family protein